MDARTRLDAAARSDCGGATDDHVRLNRHVCGNLNRKVDPDCGRINHPNAALHMPRIDSLTQRRCGVGKLAAIIHSFKVCSTPKEDWGWAASRCCGGNKVGEVDLARCFGGDEPLQGRLKPGALNNVESRVDEIALSDFRRRVALLNNARGATSVVQLHTAVSGRIFSVKGGEGERHLGGAARSDQRTDRARLKERCVAASNQNLGCARWQHRDGATHRVTRATRLRLLGAQRPLWGERMERSGCW